MLFVACLGQQGLAPTTIKTYLSGVHQMQIATGYPDINLPLQPRLHQVLKGVERLHGIRGASARPRHASRSLLTSSGRCLEQSGGHKAGQQKDVVGGGPDGLLRVLQIQRSDSPTGGGVQPRSTPVVLDLAYNQQRKPSMVSILLQRTKTDQACRGVKATCVP